VRAAVRAGASYLADVVAKIIKQFTGVAPLVLAIGCESTAPEQAAPPPAAPAVKVELQRPVESDEPRPLGQFSITFYYVIGEDEVVAKAKAANDNDTQLAAVAPEPALTTIYDPKCEAIADVSDEFAKQLELQGTGKLHDGRVLNIAGRCHCDRTPCFQVTPTQWGTAGTGRPLQPFRTVAVDPKVVKLGSLLYVPLLEGRVMPGRPPWGGYVHDGCVVADDTGGHIDGNQLDLFVGRKAYFLGISGSGGSHAWARHVPVFDGSRICERKGRVVAKKAGSI